MSSTPTVEKRRPDLAISYVHTADLDETPSMGGAMKVLPMAGMFMRSKILAWAAMFVALQTYLSEPENPPEGGAGLSAMVTSLMSLTVNYADFVFVPKKAATN